MKGNCPVPTFGCCPVRHLLSVLVPLFLCFLPFCPVHGQVWLENFSGAPPAPGWSANFPECDNTGASFDGVRNGRYEVQDREGNCCPTLDGGDNEGYWTTNAIDISTACNVSVSVRYGSSGVMECEPGGPHFGCTPCPSPALPSCITDGHDQMVFQYRVDGGPWIQFGYVCGNGAGVFNSGPVGAGNTIEIRINAANKSVSEVYWFDDVTVLGSNAPVMNPVADVTVCAGQPIVRNFTPTGGGITYSWTNSNTLTGLPAAGTGNINVPSNSTITTVQTGTVTVTPRIGACVGTPRTFSVTVVPGTSVDPIPPQTFCAGAPIILNFSSTSSTATYNWTNSNVNTGIPASGTGNINVPANAVTTVQNATLTVRANESGCLGPPRTVQITVRPLPTVNQPNNITRCAGQNATINFTGTGTPVYEWTNSNPAIGLGPSGTGNINFATAAPGGVQQTATITVTPRSGNCVGNSVNFTITVNPPPVMQDPPDLTVCPGDPIDVMFSGAAPGATYSWTNTNGSIGVPTTGSGNISAVATGSTNPIIGVFTVRATENSCIGLPQNFSVVVSPAPVLNAVSNVTRCSGQAVTINFGGTTGATFQWSNNNTSTGLAASGTGNISFTAATVTAAQTSSITVTPRFGNCTGTAQTFTLTITPGPVVNAVAPLNLCGNDPISVLFTGSSPTATYTWSNNNTNVGIGASGTGNISGTAAAVTTTETAVINVVANDNGCTSTPRTFNIVVSPPPVVNPVSNISTCAGNTVSVVFSGTTGATFAWSNSNTNIGLTANGTGSGLNFTATNGGSTTETATITVTPRIGTCNGVSTSFTITIQPPATVNPPSDVASCLGGAVAVNFSGTATAYSWSNSNTTIGLAATGTGNIGFNATALGTTTVTVQPTGGTCPGTSRTFIINITNTVDINPVANVTQCSGDTVRVNFTGTAGGTYQWTNNNTTIGLGAAGSGPLKFAGTASGTPQTATVTVTPSAGSCTGLPVSFNITIRPGIVPVISGNKVICAGDSVTLASSAATAYQWNGGQTTQSIVVKPLVTTTYTVRATGANGCSGSVTATVRVNQPTGTTLLLTTCNPAQAGVQTRTLKNAFGCDSVVTTITTLLRSDTTRFSLTTCVPAQAGVNTQRLTNRAGCDSLIITTTTLLRRDTTRLNLTTCNPAQAGTATQRLTNRVGCDSLVITTTALLRRDTTRLTARSCNPAQAGTTTRRLTNRVGCDSLVILTTVLDPAGRDTTRLTRRSCNPAQTGTTQQIFPGSDGCDSLVITTTLLSRRDTTRLSRTTCNPAQAGTTTRRLPNLFGCDSLVITTTTLLRRDTTRLGLTTCNPAQAGTVTQRLTNRVGCDSLVITTTTLLRRDTTRLTARSCNPAQTGVSVRSLTNRLGCDSVVITTTTLLRSDTTRLTLSTCLPQQAGTTTQRLTNRLGCDSLVITTVLLARRDTTRLSVTTCNPLQAGTTTKRLLNQAGCDSLVITTTALLRSDTTRLSLTTCIPAQAGTTTRRLTNRTGCDSLVITTATLLRSDTTRLSRNTCDPFQAGTTTRRLINRSGCDSLVITTTALLRSDTTRLNATTCASTQTGTSIRRLKNLAGCDSLVITTTTFDPVRCNPQVVLNARPATCADRSDGTAIINLTGGEPPFQYVWSNSAGATGSGNITSLNTPVNISNMPPGEFKVTITQPNSTGSTTYTIAISAPGPVQVNATAMLKAPPYAVRCASDQDAGAATLVSGGTGSYLYNWNTNATTSGVSGLKPGTYTVTVTDQNRCSATASVELKAPPSLLLRVQVLTPVCGATTTEAFVQTDGGLAPYILRVNGNFTSNDFLQIPNGSNTITATDANGCSKDTVVQVSIPPVISLYLPRDTSILLGQELTLTGLTNAKENSLDTIIWSPLADNLRAGTLTQVWRPLVSNVYKLTLIDKNGCQVSASTRVLVRREANMYVPNIFTPNGDGRNDILTVSSSEDVQNLELVRIFDRWGNMVYEWEGSVAPRFWPGWDGKTGNDNVGVGVYVYYLRARLVNGDIIFKDGDITVAR